jgi:hypothetical protein
MTRAFITATDDSLINLIKGARTRLALIAPGNNHPGGAGRAARISDLFGSCGRFSDVRWANR